MNKKFDDIKGFIQLGTMILIDAFLILGIIKMFFGWGETIISGILGFIGAIVGGVITFIGVRHTIMFQIKKDRLERLPEIINNSWKIKKQFLFVLGMFYALKHNPEINDVELIKDFYKNNEEWVTELSAKISPDMYNLVNSFFTHIHDYEVYKKRNDINKWFEEASEYLSRIDHMIDSYEKEYKKTELY
ncbi:hypothetical protein [Symbiobacterium thermophilum]|uniref:hypothetical protein n=1 Tax=Symbiobacterium thermophilum TaxID=2734 RepID=UPI002353DE99|nr:hypothetical protein [Symbiobacterium thermophilum]